MDQTKLSLLWEVSATHGISATKSSYVFGSIHCLDKKLISVCEEVSSFVSQCEVLLTEVDLDDLNLDELSSMGLLGDDESLSDLIGKQLFAKYRDKVLSHLDFDLSQYLRYKPLFVLMILNQRLIELSKLHGSVDEWLWSYGKSCGMKLGGAETMQDHLSVFSRISLESQLSLLKRFCKKIKSAQSQLVKMKEVYLKGDVRQLYLSTKSQSGSSRRELLYKRNVRMYNTFLDYINSKSPTLMAVGGAHLWGKHGILALLKRSGYKVRPVRLTSLTTTSS